MMRVAALCLFVLNLAAPGFAADLPPALVDAYLQAQTALVADSMKELPDAAKAIEDGAAGLGSAAPPVVDGARKMAAAKDLAGARTAFGAISAALISYAETSGAVLPAGLHIAYCPMANKPWLQKGTDIKNPYYGAAMPTCGSIKK